METSLMNNFVPSMSHYKVEYYVSKYYMDVFKIDFQFITIMVNNSLTS